jgi:hypothetical protein
MEELPTVANAEAELVVTSPAVSGTILKTFDPLENRTLPDGVIADEDVAATVTVKVSLPPRATVGEAMESVTVVVAVGAVVTINDMGEEVAVA